MSNLPATPAQPQQIDLNNTTALAQTNVSHGTLESRVTQFDHAAKLLAERVKANGWAQEFQDREGRKRSYLKVDAWTYLGGVLEVTVTNTHRWENSVCITEATLTDANGKIVSKGIGYCGDDKDGNNWRRASAHVKSSMSQTRAQGKAFRQKFGFIANLAGFESTPAEEMPEFLETQLYDCENKSHKEVLMHIFNSSGKEVSKEAMGEISQQLHGKARIKSLDVEANKLMDQQGTLKG